MTDKFVDLDGKPFTPQGSQVPHYLSADESINFWNSMAKTFSRNPALDFEKFNEPLPRNPPNVSRIPMNEVVWLAPRYVRFWRWIQNSWL